MGLPEAAISSELSEHDHLECRVSDLIMGSGQPGVGPEIHQQVDNLGVQLIEVLPSLQGLPESQNSVSDVGREGDMVASPWSVGRDWLARSGGGDINSPEKKEEQLDHNYLITFEGSFILEDVERGMVHWPARSKSANHV